MSLAWLYSHLVSPKSCCGSFSLRPQFTPEAKPPVLLSNPVVQRNLTMCFCLNTLYPEQDRIAAVLLPECPRARSPLCPGAEVPGGAGTWGDGSRPQHLRLY